jgi:hypothetical protein
MAPSRTYGSVDGVDPALLALPALALVDSTSTGTLLLPAWMLLSSSVRGRRVVLFLMIVMGLYWLVGLVLLGGGTAALAAVRAGPAPPWLLLVQLAVGILLLVYALLPDRLRPTRRRPGRMTALRDRLTRPGAGGTGALLGLAVVAVGLELLTMLPYLGAIALLAAGPLPTVASAAVLLGYCGLMVLPGLLLVAARAAAASKVEPLLLRLEAWSRRASGEAVLWVAGIAGFLLVSGAVRDLGWLDGWG